MSDYPKGAVVPCKEPGCGFLIMNAAGGWRHVDTHGQLTDHKAAPQEPARDPVDVIAAAIYKARWVDNFGKEPVLATDEAIARAVLDALEQAATVEWAVQTKTFNGGEFDRTYTSDGLHNKPFTEEQAKNHSWLNPRSPVPARPVSRMVWPWKPVEG